MDHFMEEVVTKKKRTVDEILYLISWPALVLTAIMGLMMISSTLTAILNGIPFGQLIFGLLIGLLNAGMAVFIFLFHDRLRTEYEYTFTNGDLDFAQVYNNKKRKSLGSLKIKNVEACGKVSGSAFQRYITMPGIQQTRWFLNREAELYYFFFQKDSSKRIIICEPSEDMMAMVKQYLPRGAWQE